MLVAVFAVVFAMVGTATAAKLISGKQIKNNSVTSKDVRNNTLTTRDLKDGKIRAKDLSPNAIAALATSYSNPQWGVIARNTIGSAVADLRGGPFVGDDAPPFGDGSLGLQTSDQATSFASDEEKVSFGNEADFVDDPVAGVSELGFHVFTTGENVAAGAPNPNITFEIDSNLDGADDYTSMVFIPPAPAVVNTWGDYIDATDVGQWYLTGSEGTISGCSQGSTCTFEDLQTALDDGGEGASVLTLAVTKGRDSTFAGAVDGLRLNETIYDFEPFGVMERAAGE